MKFSQRKLYTYAIEDTRHAHAARRPKIRGSHHQNLKLQQDFFFSWSTIKITTIVLLYIIRWDFNDYFMFHVFLINSLKVALLLFRNKKRFRRNNFASNSRNLQGKQRHLQTKWEPSHSFKKMSSL
jgi:hypothetical protein